MTITSAPPTAATSSSATTHVARAPGQRWLPITLRVIAAFQFALGAAFLLAPGRSAALLDLPAAPGWTAWLFGMMGARFLGYGAGMLAAARRPRDHRLWIDTMIAIQAADWVLTIVHLANGDVALRQVTTAAFVPLVFVGVLLAGRPRRSEAAA